MISLKDFIELSGRTGELDWPAVAKNPSDYVSERWMHAVESPISQLDKFSLVPLYRRLLKAQDECSSFAFMKTHTAMQQSGSTSTLSSAPATPFAYTISTVGDTTGGGQGAFIADRDIQIGENPAPVPSVASTPKGLRPPVARMVSVPSTPTKRTPQRQPGRGLPEVNPSSVPDASSSLAGTKSRATTPNSPRNIGRGAGSLLGILPSLSSITEEDIANNVSHSGKGGDE